MSSGSRIEIDQERIEKTIEESEYGQECRKPYNRFYIHIELIKLLKNEQQHKYANKIKCT
jgi:hypothetical protein